MFLCIDLGALMRVIYRTVYRQLHITVQRGTAEHAPMLTRTQSIPRLSTLAV
jgi:hypothetical protein